MKKIVDLALSMYANEPCRICGKTISPLDVADAVYVGYNEDCTSRAAHKRCFETVVERCERQRQWIEDLQSGQYVNCVYCGHQYGPEDSTPVSRTELLKRHAMECPEHPMAQMKKALELVPPLLKQVRGLANDVFGGPSSLTDCVDLVLSEIRTALDGGQHVVDNQ